MNDVLFGERRRALEEAFFREHEAERLAEIRAEIHASHARDELREATGIADQQVLAHLVEMGMTPETLVATAVIPLVEVAWADGKLEEKERAQVLREARAMELAGAPLGLLEDWLAHEPDPALFATWAEYLQALLPRLEPLARDHLLAATHQRAMAVAEAAGGEPYGLGRRVSGEEHHVLDRIDAAFEPQAVLA